MATTGEDILWQQYEALKVTLPRFVYARDWERAKLYYYAKIEQYRRLIEKYTEKVDEFEVRVAKLTAVVVALENA